MSLSHYLRSCAYCGFWFGSHDFFCQNCWEELSRQLKFESSCQYWFDNRYLFRWEEENKLIGSLIYGLKGGCCGSSVTRILGNLVGESWLENLDECVLVPSPPTSLGSRDHAYVIAEALSDLYGGSLRTPLRRTGDLAQKKLAKTVRKEKQLGLDPDYTPSDLNTRRIIFIDDVITTGSTAQAAFVALGRPRNFSVLAMAYRPLLATEAHV